MLIHDLLSRGARLHPQRTALKTETDGVTYRQLDGVVEELSQRIERRGWSHATGGLFLENSIEYAAAFFGVSKAGGVSAPTASSLPAARLAGELAFSDARYVITQPKYADCVRAAAAEAPQLAGMIVIERGGRVIRDESFQTSANGNGSHQHGPCESGASEQPAAMFATSGTAAEPKRVVLSHRNMLSNVASFLAVANLSPVNKGLILLPMTAIGAATTELLAYLAVGMTTRLYRGVFVLGEFCRTIAEERCQVVNLTPFILNVMLDRSDEVASRIRSLRKVFFASAPFPRAQFERLREAFPDVQFYYGYGQTEASPRCTTLLPSQQPAKLGSSGQPLPNVDVAIVDAAGETLDSGRTGEVVVRGPNVMLGYYKRPELSSRVVKEGWLHTGDCGYLDGDGFLFIRGRKKNVVVTRGITVNPEEVEHEIAAHPAVKESLVTALNDERVGELLVADVVLLNSHQLTEQALKTFLRDRLEPAKIPARIAFVPSLKRNHHNKLVRS